MLLNSYRFGGGAAGTSVQYWNPADVSTDLVLSAADLVATRGAAAVNYRGVRALAALGSTKKYWEVTITADGGDFPSYGLIGICEAGASLSTFVGDSPLGVGYAAREGCRYANSARSPYSPGTWPVGNAGTVVMFAADPAAGLLWIGINGAWLSGGNPVAGTGAVGACSAASYPATSIYQPGCAHRGNFVGPFAYTPPAGFFLDDWA